MFKVAITGSLGAGKTTVGNILKDLGHLIIDTDEIVHDILKVKNYTTQNVVKEFGDSILSENSNESYINRKALAEIVFHDVEKRKKLESLLHPVVRKILSELFTLNSDKDIGFVLVPLLFETGAEKMYEESWCVACKEDVQLKRLKERGMTEEDIKSRLKCQMPQEEKAKLATFVIDNSGSLEETKKQIQQRLTRLVQLARSLHLSSDTQR